MRTVILELPDDLAKTLQNSAERHGFSTSAALIVDHLNKFEWVFDEPAESEIETWLQTTVTQRLKTMDDATTDSMPLKAAFESVLSRARDLEKQNNQ